ncbi:MAG: hypothetical protein CMQ15_10705 [Gammaproteobacteria bacterium]|nr:hypothetical protein [Gammaproteobacteria bacterium]
MRITQVTGQLAKGMFTNSGHSCRPTASAVKNSAKLLELVADQRSANALGSSRHPDSPQFEGVPLEKREI